MSIIGNPIMAGASGVTASIFVTGLSETDTVTAVHKTIVKYPNPDTRGLPDGYTELEYIEGTGTQYINTGLPLNSSYIMTKSVSIGYGYIYGVDNYTSGIGNCNLTTDGSYVNVGWGTAWVSMQKASYNTTEKTSITRISDGSSTNFTVNGVSYSAGSSGYRSNPSSFYVFARNNSASGAPSGETTTDLKLYSLSFYTSPDTCVRDFVPAKRNSDGEFGLYDLVNKVFYTNAGTGTFIAGSEIPAYIETFVEDKTLTGKWDSGMNGFMIKHIRDFGTWTVTATDGEQTATQDVLVDVITEYEIEMLYSKLWLYRYGDQCEDVTGGWTKNVNASISSYSSAYGSVTFEDESILVVSPNGKAAVATTSNAVSVDSYSKLKVQFGTMDESSQGLYITESNSGDIPAASVGTILAQSSNTELELDISSLTGSYYFSCANCNGRSCQYKAIWLEV